MKNLALPAFVSVEIEFSTMEKDRGLEMLDVAEATSRFLHPLDRRIEGFDCRIGDAMLQVGEHVGEVASNELRDLRHRKQSTMDGTPEPAAEEPRGRTAVGVVSEKEDHWTMNMRRLFATILITSVVYSTSAAFALTIIPDSALTPTTQLYTDIIGGGNAANVGDVSGRNDDEFRGPINLGFTTPLNFFGTK